jgi:hypothetical protein
LTKASAERFWEFSRRPIGLLPDPKARPPDSASSVLRCNTGCGGSGFQADERPCNPARGLVSLLLGQVRLLTDESDGQPIVRASFSSPRVPFAKPQLTSDRQVPNNARMPISQPWHCLAAVKLRWALPDPYPPCSQGAGGQLPDCASLASGAHMAKACRIFLGCDLRPCRSIHFDLR